MMEEVKRYHFHVDVFCVHEDKAYPIRESRPLPKRVAEREFIRTVEEYRMQVGKFRIRPAREVDQVTNYPGAVKIAENHRLVVVLTRCDCDEH